MRPYHLAIKRQARHARPERGAPDDVTCMRSRRFWSLDGIRRGDDARKLADTMVTHIVDRVCTYWSM
jgi:hypothetical protein